MKAHFTLSTQHLVAVDSPDHLYPVGTIKDNSTNHTLIQRFKGLDINSVLDIGCAGGAFVEDLLEAGIEAVGVEGSDISQKMGRASWPRIPNNLFLADATKPFVIKVENDLFTFDVVTAWEFFEHVAEDDLSQVMYNIRRHTHSGSQLICSISNFPSPAPNKPEIDLHQTREELGFWLELFEEFEFFRDEPYERYYEGNWVRYGTFNLVLRRFT